MKLPLSLAVFAIVLINDIGADSPPKVQVYTRGGANYGDPDQLVCHVNNFMPPEVTTQLLADGVEMPGSTETTLAFNPEWNYHVTRSVSFTAKEGVSYTCRIKHATNPPKEYHWEPES